MTACSLQSNKGKRKFTKLDVQDLLDELQKNPEIASFCAYNDFRYFGRGLPDAQVEREYWLKISRTTNTALPGTDGLAILHVHYAGTWPKSDSVYPSEKRSQITQINISHTWQGYGLRFYKPCKDPGGELHGKIREKFGEAVLVTDSAGWNWRKPAEKDRTFNWQQWNHEMRRHDSRSLSSCCTSSLQDLLVRGETFASRGGRKVRGKLGSASSSAAYGATFGSANCETFTICLNPAVTAGHTPSNLEALQREFADWHPGPVLLPPETEIRYRNKWGKVVAHLQDDPHTVLVRLNGESKNVRIFFRKIYLKGGISRQEDRYMQSAVDSLLSPAANGAQVTVIGYNEFTCDDHLEREYWLSLDAAKFAELPIPVTAGQLPLRTDLSLCVVHVQYSGKVAASSEVSRTSVRPLHPMQAIELRAHRDKCITCRQCKQRSECPQCQKCNLIFARLCFSSSRCARCQGCKKNANCKSKKLCSAYQEDTPAISCQKCLNRVVGECVACKDCIACTDCLECPECLDEKDFTSCQSCRSHFDCDNCRNYKWANRYGVQLIGPQAGLKHIYDRAQEVTMHTLSLNDTTQRRFALLIGNSAYASTIYKTL